VRAARLGLCVLLGLGCGDDKGGDASSATAAATATSGTTAPTGGSGDASTTSTTSGTSTSVASSTGETPLPVPNAEFCPLDWSAASAITGEAPFGQFSGAVAWFEWQFCNGYFPLVIVVEDAAVVEQALENGTPLTKGVAIMLPGPGWEYTAIMGDLKPRVFAIVDGEFTDPNGVEGTATVTAGVSVSDTALPEGIPHISGSFSIDSQQTPWKVSGTFDAAYCGRFNNLLAMSC
jgi:hypothetical protein